MARCFVFLILVELVGFLRVQGHGRGLYTERTQGQLGNAIQQAGQRLQQGEGYFQQAGAEADERLRVAPGQAPRQVFGKHQQDEGGGQPGQPEAVLAAVALANQAGQAQHQQLAQAGAQHQGLGRQHGLAVLAGAQRAIELQAGGIHRGEQRRPQQRQCQGAE
ncbi:hypothetical protein D3C81_1005660 [compost metagenome]